MDLNLKRRKWAKKGYIGVDLDGTLAEYHGWQGIEHIGDPVSKMLERVKQWIENGQEVRIITARAENGSKAIKYIEEWLEKNGIGGLEITNEKTMDMIVLYDDRAV